MVRVPIKERGWIQNPNHRENIMSEQGFSAAFVTMYQKKAKSALMNNSIMTSVLGLMTRFDEDMEEVISKMDPKMSPEENLEKLCRQRVQGVFAKATGNPNFEPL